MLLTAGAGYGKTTVLEQALGEAARPAAWIRCSATERAPETLLSRILEAVANAAPGASDALVERLAFPAERVGALAAARELTAELTRLLIEPVVLVVDDAEQLEDAEGSLGVLSELIRAEVAPLRVAIASRRPLELRVAKARAAGRLAELSPTELAFDGSECAELLRARAGRDPTPEDVEGLVEATEGWPLGIALAVADLEKQRAAGGGAEFRELRSGPDLRAFFTEELLESLSPDLREKTISSSVARVVTPEVASALELQDSFAGSVEQAGMLIRRQDDGRSFAYHPLLRAFLLERLDAERGEEERRRLHGAVAAAVAAAGEPIDAIEHWLAAEDWTGAVRAIEQQGPVLVRSAPGLMERWFTLLPADSRALPTMLTLQGQLAWVSGDNERAIEALQGAVRGFRDDPDPPAEWLARSMLVDSLFAAGGVDRLEEVVEGWDRPAAEPAGGLAPAAAMYGAVVLAAYARFEQSESLARAARSHPHADLVGPLDGLRFAFAELPRGDLDAVMATVENADRELRRFDPLNRRPHLLGAEAFILDERGEPERALRMWMEIRETVRGGLAPVLEDATYAWCALLHARAGRLAEAEEELAQHQGNETGYRAYIAELAPAAVAALRGDSATTLGHADRALAVVEGGPIVFRASVGVDLVPLLAAVGQLQHAEDVLEGALRKVDELLPGARGRLYRGRLLALRAWMRHSEGDLDQADADLVAFWDAAEVSRRFTVRREWDRLRPVIWSALERGSLAAEPTVRALGEAFPDGLQLVAFLDHPVVAVRRAALAPTTRSGAPSAIEHLRRLATDPDPGLAEDASRAVQTLALTLPPLRFEVLGGFDVGRGSWRVGHDWGRPVDARLVRFLLAHLDAPVPEDLIFAALWPELSPPNARKSLQVAASRARRVLDPPGADRSVLESADRSYRLALGDQDRIDAEDFRTAAGAALARRDQQRLPLLQRARSLWTGEPLPSERYADWAAAYRERLIDSYTAVLAGLVEIRERAGDHVETAEVARSLVDLDPLNEGGHRALITAYARAGRTGQALRQYLECRRALVEELGVEPAEETSRLQARILAGEPV